MTTRGPVYAVIGWPLTHTLSPAMYRAAFSAAGIEASYVALATRPADLADAMRGVRALGLAGLNVTIPHKEGVIAHLDALDDSAREVGAVNTIARRGEELVGANTDAAGFADAMAEAGVALRDRRVAVIGAGGAAKAVAVAARDCGAREVCVFARRAERARDVAALVTRSATTRGDGYALEGSRDALARADVLVNATPATTGTAGEAFVRTLPLDVLSEHAVVVDLAYVPRETALLHAARARGLRTVDGLGMLLHQGMRALAVFGLAHAANATVMRAALLRGLEGV